MSPLAVLASVFVVLAGLVHIYIFLLESVLWSKPSTWKIFGFTSQEQAETVRPMAYNQGFYNLFLAVGALLGTALWWTASAVSGEALVLFATGSMVLAATVLISTGKRNLRPAAIQGVLPLVGFVLTIVS
jgi:putative membrane protein